MAEMQLTQPLRRRTARKVKLLARRRKSPAAAQAPFRLLMVTPRYLPFPGGVQTHVYQLSRRFVQAGLEVTVLTSSPGGRLPEEEWIDGVRVRRVPAWPANRDYYFAPQIVSFIRSQPWDLIHVQSYHSLVAPLAMWAAWRSHTPYVVTFHGGGHSSRLRSGLRGMQQRLLRPMLARANRLIAIAEFEIPFFSQRLGLPVEQFSLIPNGGDLPAVAGEAQPVVEAGLIVSIGRLERYKGHQRVIAAMPEILARRPDARLWIAGSGPYEDQLRRQAQELGVADRVQIYAIPAADREGMARALAQAGLVVLLSEFETHPIAVLEALALGRPALVADTSGLSELAHKGLARAIPLHSSPGQVAQAVIEQLDQPAQPGPLSLPTWEDCSAGLLSLYSEITGRRLCAS
ncbi:MAG: glycosyltransferase family 4 protein [Chloroflexota bacterium]